MISKIELLSYPEVLEYMKKTYQDRKIQRTVKRGIWMSGWIIKNFRNILNEWKEYEERYRQLTGRGYIMALKDGYSDIKFYLPFVKVERKRMKGDLIQRTIFKSQSFFDINQLEMLKDSGIVKSGMNILDIGANIGNHTLYFTKVCKVNYVYAFEPMPKTFEILSKNCQINGLDNVLLNNYALGRERTTVGIKNFDEDNLGGTSLKYGEGGICCQSLDKLDINKKIDFIKIDVEGFEKEVLLGGVELIKRDKPQIYIEIFEKNKNAVDAIMQKMGYVNKKKWNDDYLYVPKGKSNAE